MKGPVLLRQDNTQITLGFGMAPKVLVENWLVSNSLVDQSKHQSRLFRAFWAEIR